MNFKPNIKKISLSILISIILSVLFRYYDYARILWELRADGTYPSFFEYFLGLNNLISSIILMVVVFIIIYVVWSLIEKKKKRNKK